MLYVEYEEILEDLTDEEMGRLFRAILKYERTQELTELPMQILIPFKFIRKNLDNNRKKWVEKCEKNKANVGKRWNKADTKTDDGINGIPNDTTVSSEIPIDTKHTDNESDHSCKNDYDSQRESNECPLTQNAPTFEEVEEFAATHGVKHLARKFFDNYTQGAENQHWRDSSGKRVVNWRQKFLSWKNHERPPKILPQSVSGEERGFLGDYINQFGGAN